MNVDKQPVQEEALSLSASEDIFLTEEVPSIDAIEALLAVSQENKNPSEALVQDPFSVNFIDDKNRFNFSFFSEKLATFAPEKTYLKQEQPVPTGSGPDTHIGPSPIRFLDSDLQKQKKDGSIFGDVWGATPPSLPPGMKEEDVKAARCWELAYDWEKADLRAERMGNPDPDSETGHYGRYKTRMKTKAQKTASQDIRNMRRMDKGV